MHVKISNFNQCQKNKWEKAKFNKKGKDYFIALIVTLEHFNSAEQWNQLNNIEASRKQKNNFIL